MKFLFVVFFLLSSSVWAQNKKILPETNNGSVSANLINGTFHTTGGVVSYRIMKSFESKASLDAAIATIREKNVLFYQSRKMLAKGLKWASALAAAYGIIELSNGVQGYLVNQSSKSSSRLNNDRNSNQEKSSQEQSEDNTRKVSGL